MGVSFKDIAGCGKHYSLRSEMANGACKMRIWTSNFHQSKKAY